MKNLFSFLLLGSFVFLLSCKDDEEPEPDPMIGTWELENIEYPSVQGFVLLTYSSNPASMYGEFLHEISFFEDQSYERELRFSDGKVEDNGNWELNDNSLDLDVDDADDPDLILSKFTLSGDIEEGSISLEASTLWPVLTTQFAEELNAVMDTFTTQQSYQEVLFANIQSVEVDLILEFEKQR